MSSYTGRSDFLKHHLLWFLNDSYGVIMNPVDQFTPQEPILFNPVDMLSPEPIEKTFEVLSQLVDRLEGLAE